MSAKLRKSLKTLAMTGGSSADNVSAVSQQLSAKKKGPQPLVPIRLGRFPKGRPPSCSVIDPRGLRGPAIACAVPNGN